MQQERARQLAGVSLVGIGVLMLLVTTTAEAFYPGYSTTTQTISALGAADAPNASQLVFNGGIIVAGLWLTVAAYGLHRVYGNRLLTGMVALTALGGLVGVGVFPSQTGLPHLIAAIFAFGGSGATALVAASVFRGPFRVVSAVMGVLVLATFVLFFTLGGSTPLGVGGLERWVHYLSLAWTTAAGGYLLAPGSGPREA